MNRAFVAVVLSIASFGCEALFPSVVAEIDSGPGDTSKTDTSEAGSPCPCGAWNGTSCVPTIIAQGPSGVTGLATDGAYVYWTTASKLLRVPVTGGNPETLYGGLQDPQVIALSPTTVFVAGGTQGNVLAVSLDGGNPHDIATAQLTPFGVAVDSDHVYWTTLNPQGSVVRASLDGGGRVPLATQRDSPAFVAVDSSYVYWTESDFDGGVMRIPIDGGAITPLATGFDHPWGLAVDSTNVYFSVDDGRILQVDKTGATSPTTFDTGQVYPKGMTLDSKSLYWANDVGGGGGAVVRDSLQTPGAPTPIASGQGFVLMVGLDERCVYWGEGDTGNVWRAEK